MTSKIMFAGSAILALLLNTSCKKEQHNQAGIPKDDPSATKLLRFSAIPDENTTEQSVKFNSFAAYLSEKLKINTEFIPTTDYGAAVNKFVNGEIHLAWFGGLTGVQARNEVTGARAIAQGFEDPEYISYFIANSETELKLSDSFPAKIREMKFTFGSKESTSGRLMPSYFIEKETGTAPDKWFTKPLGFSGAHDKTAKLVEAGTFQVGALSYKKYHSMVESGNLDKEKCRVIWKTPPYADYNWTAHPDLEKIFGVRFIDKLQKVLTEITDPDLLKILNRSKIIPAKNEDFQGIADVAKQLGFLNN